MALLFVIVLVVGGLSLLFIADKDKGKVTFLANLRAIVLSLILILLLGLIIGFFVPKY